MPRACATTGTSAEPLTFEMWRAPGWWKPPCPPLCRPRGHHPRPPVQGSVLAAPQLAVPLSPSQVDDLKAKLAIQEAELKLKNENADKLIQVVGVETEKVSKEKAVADEEEAKVEVINKVGMEGRVASWAGQHTDPGNLEACQGSCFPPQGTLGAALPGAARPEEGCP